MSPPNGTPEFPGPEETDHENRCHQGHRGHRSARRRVVSDLIGREAIRQDPLASSFAASSAGVIAFIAVASEGSFAKAANRLGVGRSAVSRSVQKLEEQLAARLFFRTTRSTTLTHEGGLFYANCQPAVAQIVQALDEMRELRSGPPRGHLRISSGVGFGRNLVAPLLGGFKALYPEISTDLVLADNSADFSSDRIDVAFRDGPLQQTQMVTKRLMPMQLLVCASPEYARVHGLPGSVDDLVHHRCINYRLASGRIYEWVFEVEGRLRRFTPTAMHTFNDACLVRDAVLDGRGIAQVPRYQIYRHIRNGELLACLPQDLPDDHGHYICYLSRQHLPARVRAFIDYMTDRIRAPNLQCNT
jgi:DNA-binding transcriptional LysR family regulator